MECFIPNWIIFGLVFVLFTFLALSFKSLPLCFFSFLCVIIIAARFFNLRLYILYSVLQFNLQFLTARGEFSQ